MLPFTQDQFLNSILLYHEQTWPAVWILNLAAVLVAVGLIWKPELKTRRLAFLFLGTLWLWMGFFYHIKVFSIINPAANLFGALFILQAVLLFVHGLRLKKEPVQVKPSPAFLKNVAYFFLLYALVIYPIVGVMTGHAYPRGPIFGLPCPGTIYTFALLILLNVNGQLLVKLLVIPVIWSAIGTFAAVMLGITADWMLGLSALLVIALYGLQSYKVRDPSIMSH